MIQVKMNKILTLALSVLVLFTGRSYGQDQDFPQVGALYRAVFADKAWSATQYMDSSLLYVIKVDAVSRSNPNWVLIEFPREANRSHPSPMRDQRWINLNYVVLLKPFAPGTGN
jgi:hypothetical protein